MHIIKPYYFIPFFLFITMLHCSCKPNNASKKEVQIVDLEQLNDYLNKDDKLYIVNFWATWCKPCVAELPYFEKLNNKLNADKAEVILVSLDFESDFDKKLLPFIKNKKLKSRVMLLNAGKPVYWIDKVNENWSGSIPATMLFCKKLDENDYLGLGNFYEGEISYEKLNNWIKLNLQLL